MVRYNVLSLLPKLLALHFIFSVMLSNQHSSSPHLSFAIAVSHELLCLATFCTGSGSASGTGSGSASGSGTRTMIGFEAVGLNAL